MDFERGHGEGEAPGAAFGTWSLVAGALAMLANMFWIPLLNVFFTLAGVILAVLGLRRDRKGTDDYSRAVAGLILGLGNVAVLLVVVAMQLGVAAMVVGMFFLVQG